jgi:threonine aldolase
MGPDYIDLRSDTVTRPSHAMRETIARAEVGDDVFGEDPTVNSLQEYVADLLGKEAALFVPSGTMGNQICIKVHTRAGDEVVVEKECHVFNYETAGMAFLSAVQVHTVEGSHGVLPLEALRRAIRPEVYYMPRTALICIENTHNRAGGTIYPLEKIKEVSAFARQHGIGLHLDGARLWNACVATGITPEEYAREVDSVSVCLSKGLGAPVGSLVVGSREFIVEARRYRKIFGGGMRQAGLLAAAGMYALKNNVSRLTEDHEKAGVLAHELAQVRGVVIDLDAVHTNIVIANVEGTGKTPGEILGLFKSQGVLLSQGTHNSIRAVTHMDVSMEDVKRAASAIRKIMN